MIENSALEFKEDITNTFLKTVSAFSNFNGGKIIFGLDDNGGIVGIDNPIKSSLDIENRINDSIKPKPEYTIEIDKEKSLIILNIYEGLYKPYFYKGKAYRRSNTATIEVDQFELKRLILESENLSYEELPVDKKDLSFSYLFNSLEKVLNIEVPSDDLLKSLGLLRSDGKYNNAAVLLSDDNTFPGIDIIKFGKSINDIRFRKTIENTSILEEFKIAEEVFENYYKIEEINGMTRKTKYLVPIEAFRETIANALVHRLWDISSNIRILMFNDKVEVFSPSGLDMVLTKEEYVNGYVSYLRNPIIANIFFRLGIIEMFGTGIRRIKEVYNDKKNKPIFEVKENSILTILPSDNKKLNLTSEEKNIYDQFTNGRILTTRELVEILDFGKDKVLNNLNSLIDKSYIKKIGKGRGTKYKINS